MSDVVVSVIESTTAVTVTEQDVAVAVTETPVTVTAATAGLQGIQGIGYTGVTSTSTITIGAGLKTFTLVSGYQGAFITGMRIRAIHSDTPTYYLEGTANYVGAGTLIITVDKFNGSGSHNLWAFASAGEVGATGATGATGASGVVSVTSPITNTGTAGSAIVGIDQTLLSLTRSQITDFTSGTVTSASTAQQSGTAVFASFSGVATSATSAATATNAGTAVYATTSGTAVFATNASTAVTISGSITQSQVTNLVTDLAGKASLGSANAFTVGGHVITNAATAVIPLVLKGAASQSGSMLQFQNSAGSITANFTAPVNNVNRLNLGGTDLSATLGITVHASGGVGQVIRGAASQTANLQEWQNSAGTVLTRIESTGNLVVPGTTGAISSGTFIIGSRNSGAEMTMVRQTAATSNPGANLARLYFRDGTNAGTLKLVVRAGAAGGEETLFDNLDTTGTSTIAIGSGVRASDATVATASNGVGYMGLPQNTTTTGAYTIVAGDAGKHIYASATRTVTIPANSALALPIGTTLTFIAGAGATMTIAITTDTMYLAGAGTTGSRTLAAHGIATAVKTTATTWIISGNGLT